MSWLPKGRRAALLHLFCGLYAAVFVVTLGVSGALLTFHDELDRALNPKLWYVTPAGAPKPLAELVAAVQQEYPGLQVMGIRLPEKPVYAAFVDVRRPGTREGMTVAVDPYTAAVLGDSDHANNFADNLRDFHSSLLLGGAGEGLVWISGVGCVALALTGVVLWWRRKRYALSGPASPTFNLDLHTVVGLYCGVFVLIYGITAVRPVPVGLVLPRGLFQPRSVKLTPPAGAKEMSLEAQVAAARQALPEAQPWYISGRPEDRTAPTVVMMRYPEDHSESPRSGVVLDPYSGAILHKSDLRSLNGFQKYAYAWNMEIHTGAIFGMPSKVVASASSLVIPLLGVTGPLIWWRRRKAKLSAAAQAAD